MPDNVITAAREYHGAGLNVLPLRNADKRPIGRWEQWQHTPQTEGDVRQLFPDTKRNVGVIGGEVSGNMVALDFESRKQFRNIIDANPHFARVASRTPHVRTGRGIHVWFRAPEPIKSAKLPAGIEGEIRASGNYVVAPPSLHPGGQRYLFTEGFKNIYTLADLNELGFIALERASETTQATQTRVTGISRRTFDIIRGQYGPAHVDRSALDATAILELVKNGWTFERTFELYRRLAGPDSKFRDKGRNGYSYLQQTYNNAVTYYRENMREFDRKVNAALSDCHNWFTGRTRHTDRAVAETVLLIARQAGRMQLALSVREIAERTGIHHDTAWKALQRLPLTPIGQAKYNSGKLYDATALLTKTDIPSHRTCDGMSVGVKSSHDAFRNGALGKSGAGLLDMLSVAGSFLTVREIARSIDASERTIHRKLQVLAEAGIVETNGEKWRIRYRLPEPVTDSLLDRIAQAFHTQGKGEKQRKEHARDRDRHRRALAHWHQNQQKTG